MRIFPLIALFMFAGTALAQAPAYQDDSNWQAVCKAAVAQPLPGAAAALAAKAAAGPVPRQSIGFPVDGCDEQATYYGYAGKPDDAAALRCGYRQRAFPQASAGDPFQGPGVLTMLYANGLGVPRDYNLAIRFACENTWAAQAEDAGRIGHLEALRDGKMTAKKPFDLCDDATSGLMEGACEWVAQGFADAKRETAIAELRAKLPAAAQAMLVQLQVEEAAYEQARSRGEVDLSGTGRGAFLLEERGKLRDQFVINLRRFASGDLPAATSAQAAGAERDEQQAFAATQAAPTEQWQYGTIKPEGIAKTEASWKQLRAQWLALAHVAYPRVSRDAVAMELDRLRAHQLRSLLARG